MKLRMPKLNAYQIILIVLTVILIIACIVATLIYFPSLPDKLPAHYGINGNVDRYGGKGTAFILPIINLAMFIMFAFFILSPKILENPKTRKPLNPHFKPLIAKETLNLLIECGFIATLLMDYMQIFTLTQKPLNTLGVWIIVGILLAASTIRSVRLAKYR